MVQWCYLAKRTIICWTFLPSIFTTLPILWTRSIALSVVSTFSSLKTYWAFSIHSSLVVFIIYYYCIILLQRYLFFVMRMSSFTSLDAIVAYVSSAYMLALEKSKQPSKSLRHTIKRRGPKHYPWRMPLKNFRGRRPFTVYGTGLFSYT